MSGEEKRSSRPCIPCRLHIAGISMTRVILWLVAIAFISFILGMAILALSGLPPGSDQKLSPFRSTALFTPNTTLVPLDGTSRGTIEVTMGAGELALRGGAPPGVMMEATVFSKAAEWQPEFAWQENGTHKTVTMTDSGHTAKEWVAIHSPNSWNIRVSDQIPLSLDVNVGAGDSRLTLGSLNLSHLTMNNGAGDTEIDLGGYRGGRFDAELVGGVGDLTLRIPGESNTLITVNNGVGDISGTGFIRRDDAYVTPGFSQSLPANRIAIRQGVGSIYLVVV